MAKPENVKASQYLPVGFCSPPVILCGKVLPRLSTSASQGASSGSGP